MNRPALVRLMIDAVENPVVPLQFATFGMVVIDDVGRHCVGCAATNMIMKLCKIDEVDAYKVPSGSSCMGSLSITQRMKYLYDIEPEAYEVVDDFEGLIDSLRHLDLCGSYTDVAKDLGMTQEIVELADVVDYFRTHYGERLPFLDDKFTEDDIEVWKEFIIYLEQIEDL